MEVQLLLTTFIVGSGLIPDVQPSNPMNNEGTINKVNGDGNIHQNFHNLFNSIVKNNVKETDTYRDILGQEAARGQQVFDTMKEKLRLQRNANKPKNIPSQNGEKVAMFKRSIAEHREGGQLPDETVPLHALPEPCQDVPSSRLEVALLISRVANASNALFSKADRPKGDIWENFETDSFDVLPKVIIFDCDFCLWPFIFDFHAQSPFTRYENGTVMDFRDRRVSHYRGIPQMLQLLKDRGIKIGLVNQTKKPKEILEILNALDWMKYVSYVMFHNGEFATHARDLIEKEHLDYQEVLYFDELPRHLVKTEKFGIISALAEYGMNPDSLKNGLTQYVDRYRNPRTRGPEEIYDEATAGRIRLKATTPVSPWTSRTTSSFYFVCTPRLEPL